MPAIALPDKDEDECDGREVGVDVETADVEDDVELLELVELEVEEDDEDEVDRVGEDINPWVNVVAATGTKTGELLTLFTTPVRTIGPSSTRGNEAWS